MILLTISRIRSVSIVTKILFSMVLVIELNIFIKILYPELCLQKERRLLISRVSFNSLLPSDCLKYKQYLANYERLYFILLVFSFVAFLFDIRLSLLS